MTREEMNLLVPQKLDALEMRHDIRVLLSGREHGGAEPGHGKAS